MTATRTCAICGDVQSETVKTTSAVTKEAAVGVPGTRTFTAEFTLPWATTQTKDVQIDPLPALDDSGSNEKKADAADKQAAKGSSTPKTTTAVKTAAASKTAASSKTATTGDTVPTPVALAAMLLGAIAFSVASWRQRREA